MESILASQIKVFLLSLVLGGILGLAYDLFRILRMFINYKNISVFIQDIIYFIISGFITFLFVFYFNYGDSRFYILAGEGIGWICYHLTLGEIIYKKSKLIKNRR